MNRNIMSKDHVRGYGWRKDKITHDHLTNCPLMYKCKKTAYHANLDNIHKVDLRNKFPKVVYDQGSLGSCTANALCAAYRYEIIKQNRLDIDVSRLFLYYQERVIEGTVNEDSGAQLHNGITVLKTTGICHENIWPYDIAKFSTKPSVKSYRDAKQHHVLDAQPISQTLKDLKQTLVDGYPIVFGFIAYASFESEEVAKTGIVPMPNKNETEVGGHAVCIVGYDDTKSTFLVRNSWGEKWGQGGYFELPYDYVTNPDLAQDFWEIKLVKDE